MLKVGVTGGIGAGKSVVCQVFKTLGIPVFNADETAKQLIENDSNIVAQVKALFGDDIYTNGVLDRTQVASVVFKQPELLQQLNAIIHPATIAAGEKWIAAQTADYIIKEAAIFFESGTYKQMDLMIGVTAPEELRIERALQRNGMTREKVQERIAQQMDDAEKMKRCDYVIINDGKEAIIPQVMNIHQQLLNKLK